MRKTQLSILKMLSDEKYVSGESIGEKLNITRAAVSASIKRLRDMYGINLLSTTSLGHKLLERVEFFDEELLKNKYSSLEYFHSVSSTSDYAMANYHKYKDNTIFIAEHQTQGHGRFNRKWSSPFGKNIYCTLLELVNLDIAKLSGISLVVAISICKVLERMSLKPEIKWPNTILVDDKIIAATMITAVADLNEKTRLFISFGANVNMQQNSDLDDNWTSLRQETGYHTNRTSLLIELVKMINKDIGVFYEKGLAPSMEEYNKYNYLADKTFDLSTDDKVYKKCKYVGLSEAGEIVVDVNGEDHAFSAGKIKVLEKSKK